MSSRRTVLCCSLLSLPFLTCHRRSNSDEFGRTPVMTPDRGRGHWTNVMSMVLAGGGYRHGQVVGATDHRGGEIKERRVTPADLAATVFSHLGIALDATWTNPQGRPMPIIIGGGRPMSELGQRHV